ncbi:class I SAM-dependent methyltransferase [Paenibacillus apii]|uniref:class I SAM-dependent methyltransferase n=1 Tax=Paenibacillus apii TaxID=1850370 RepID=UPI00143A71E7|nr:class I SAM-dependent methyltransferase [Paenibacillus apii]NJJ39726.1 class I SAM-dependent methyltransferase [Paenibacillus apii]
MSFNWINAEEFSFNSFLLMDRWMVRMICNKYVGWDEFCDNLGIALAHNPAVAWYFTHKSPESKPAIEQMIAKAPKNLPPHEIRKAEVFVIHAMETSVVYVYPDMMNQNCDYINAWDKQLLFELADFTDKVVLDLGSGTGRLAFAAAEKAKRVYASEPTDMLREYMRDKIKRENVDNVVVVDGMIEQIPYEDNSFDIVMSGHVVGDNYDLEIAELSRVVKNGGYIIDCIGEDNRKREADEELIKRGFEPFYHVSKSGGDIYRYRKLVSK